MKFPIASILAVGGLVLVGFSARAAEPVVIKSGQPFEVKGSPETRAVAACANAFVTRILPDSRVALRLVVTPGGPFFDRTLQGMQIDVALEARQKSDGALIASSVCNVDRFAKVHSLNVRDTKPELLASLKARDIFIASASH